MLRRLRYSKFFLTISAALGVFLFWWQVYPHALSYQEQYQLFLWTTDYLRGALAIPGGVAAWMGEMLVQFYYVPWLGALLLTLLFAALQLLVAFVMRREGNNGWFISSFLVTVLLIWLMGDESVLLAYHMAMAVALLAYALAHDRWPWADIIVVPALYWIIGPMAWLYVALRLLGGGLRCLWLPVLLLAVQLAAYYWLLPEWQLYSVFTGRVYYRIPLHTPTLMWVIPVAVVALTLLARLTHRRWMWACEALALLLLAAWPMRQAYNKDKYSLIELDYLVRNQQWDRIIQSATQYQVPTPFSSVCVNLALAQKRQLADRMFDFYQNGPDALVMPRIRDLTSMLPSAEAFWHLGMVNSAQRYMFDTQESILNAKKSGRCTKRIAECMIVNGHYQNAAKQLALLEKSLFYRSWAKEAKACLYNEAKVNAHPVWGRKRLLRYKDDFLFNYPRLDRMFATLFTDNKSNTMALDYLLAQMLLEGNLNDFVRNLGLAQRYGGYQSMPLVYQDVMNCVQTQGNAANSPYMNYVNRLRQRQ